MVGVLTPSSTGPAVDSCSVSVVTDLPEFLALEAEWNDAVERAAVPHPFLRHEWMRTWWDCFNDGADLHIIVVRDSGRLKPAPTPDKQSLVTGGLKPAPTGDIDNSVVGVGFSRPGRIIAIAPLMREDVRMYGIPVRRLRLMQNDHTPRADFIIAERPGQSYRAIWNALIAEHDRWDVLQLGQLPRASDTRDLLQELAANDGMMTGLWASGESPYLALDGTWDDYFTSLSAKFRSNVRNRLSRLTQLGDPVLEVLDGGPSVIAAREDSMRLEASGWKAEAGTSIHSDPAVHRFYSLLSERAATSGWLQLLFLTVAGTRIATSYGSVYDRRLFLFKTGYDPAFAKCSPFKVLMYFAVKHAYAQGLREVDFLGDAEPWKLEWTSTTRGHDWLFVFANSARARLVHRAKFQLAPAVRRWREY